MVKKALLTVAAAAFLFGGIAAIQPSPAEATNWSKDKAAKHAKYDAWKAGWNDWCAKKKAWWHNAWLGWGKAK
jgi:hypothetical protein